MTLEGLYRVLEYSLLEWRNMKEYWSAIDQYWLIFLFQSFFSQYRFGSIRVAPSPKADGTLEKGLHVW